MPLFEPLPSTGNRRLSRRTVFSQYTFDLRVSLAVCLGEERLVREVGRQRVEAAREARATIDALVFQGARDMLQAALESEVNALEGCGTNEVAARWFVMATFRSERSSRRPAPWRFASPAAQAAAEVSGRLPAPMGQGARCDSQPAHHAGGGPTPCPEPTRSASGAGTDPAFTFTLQSSLFAVTLDRRSTQLGRLSPRRGGAVVNALRPASDQTTPKREP